MSISKRFIDLARSELNSLLERASRLGDDDDGDEPAEAGAPASRPLSGSRGRVRLEDLSDQELETEIERRKLERELRDRTARPRPTASGPRPSTRPVSRPADPIARAYAALEVPPGSDFETVRKAYRAMMRKYHPDRHTASPEKQKAANELAQKLTDAYKTLEKKLRK